MIRSFQPILLNFAHTLARQIFFFVGLTNSRQLAKALKPQNVSHSTGGANV